MQFKLNCYLSNSTMCACEIFARSAYLYEAVFGSAILAEAKICQGRLYVVLHVERIRVSEAVTDDE